MKHAGEKAGGVRSTTGRSRILPDIRANGISPARRSGASTAPQADGIMDAKGVVAHYVFERAWPGTRSGSS
jgi:hypothetical protein